MMRMYSELLFYAMGGTYRGRVVGLVAYALATRCGAGSEATHFDCWEAIGDNERFFEAIGLEVVPSAGLWLARVEYESDDVDQCGSGNQDWNHLLLLDGPCKRVGLELISEILKETEDKEFLITKWKWL